MNLMEPIPKNQRFVIRQVNVRGVIALVPAGIMLPPPAGQTYGLKVGIPAIQ